MALKIHLTDKKCVACEGGIPPLTKAQIAEYQPQVPNWNVTQTALGSLRSSAGGVADAESARQATGGTVIGEGEDGVGLSIARDFSFKNFKEAITFADKVGELAEEEGHHPVLTVRWGKVGILLTTDAINGLSENDFILAAKIDRI